MKNKNNVQLGHQHLPSQQQIQQLVDAALLEDIGEGDISADLIPADPICQAKIITREPAIICGIAWANAVFQRIAPTLKIEWLIADGELASANQSLCTLQGSARSLLTAERCALNFLQTLSATATLT